MSVEYKKRKKPAAYLRLGVTGCFSVVVFPVLRVAQPRYISSALQIVSGEVNALVLMPMSIDPDQRERQPLD